MLAPETAPSSGIWRSGWSAGPMLRRGHQAAWRIVQSRLDDGDATMRA
jgi:hypothetical protein